VSLDLNRCRPFRAPRRPLFRPLLECLEGRDTPSITVLDVAPIPATVGQAVTLTAMITRTGGDNITPGVLGGTVTFFDGDVPLGAPVKITSNTLTTQGVAQLTIAGLGAGSHPLTAKYSGDSDTGGVAHTGASTSHAVTEFVITPPPPLADITSRVSVGVRRGLPRNQQLVTVTNTSGQAIEGPLYLVFVKLPKRVRLKGGSGTTQSHGPAGSPFLLDPVTLHPGGFVNFLLSFSGHKAVRFTTEVFAGTGTV
jgi:hypothetical protein